MPVTFKRRNYGPITALMFRGQSPRQRRQDRLKFLAGCLISDEVV